MKKLMLITGIFALLSGQKMIGQCGSSPYWCTNGNTATPTYLLGTANTVGLQFEVNSMLNAYMEPVNGYTGIGAWTPTLPPNYQLDVLGDIDEATAGDGYRINGQYALWLTASANLNTWVGYSGNSSGGGNKDCYIGYGSGHNTNAFSLECSFLGNLSGYNNNGAGNTFIGYQSGYTNSNGDDNVFIGYSSGYSNYSGASNDFLGNDAGYNTYNGQSNTFIGDGSGQTNYNGNGNTILGAGADVQSGNLMDASAIGGGAVVTNSMNMILGDNTIKVGIGMSNITGGPLNKLEISYYSQSGTDPCDVPISSTFTGVPCSPTPTGTSGLQFRDLNTTSAPYPYNGSNAFLTVDDNGDVVYMQPPPAVVSGTGSFGLCPPPGITGDEGLDLTGYNLYFQGNNSSSFDENDVLFGYACGFSPVPAKVSILQASGVSATLASPRPSIGLYVENDDVRYYNPATSFQTPTIGIKSYMPAPTGFPGCDYLNVAGWFQVAHPTSCTSPTQLEYAIFVPHQGGRVSIGFPLGTIIGTYPPCLLYVNGAIGTPATFIPSDSNIKKNITPFNYGIKAIRNLNPVSYKYNGIGSFDTSNTYIGLIAQNLMRNVPNGVSPEVIVKDSVTRDTETIENIYEQAVLYTAINAIKQLDSTVTVKSTTIDSLRSTLDSLRSALKGMQNCLSTLCFTGDAPVRGRGGNGNSGDSNSTITNTLDVTLSASINAPLLYQNIPNPFSTGTKINYYLPQGSIGATMVFYDTYGNQIKTVQLSQTGNGTLNITPDNLTGGIYSYSLVVNNNIIDTKRMILQK